MANLRSSKKDIRKNERRRLRNRTQRSTLRTVVKKVRVTIAGEDDEAKEAAFRLAVKKLDQAAAKGLIHKNKAARTKSRLVKLKKGGAE